jgi:hypothetical protein
MAGHFGLAGSNNDSAPAERLLETHPSLDVHELYRAGVLVEGASVVLKIPGIGCRRATRGAGNLNIDGALIPIRPHPALPLPVFGCPQCGSDRYRLHLIGGIWACRDCQKRRHRVDYASRHTHRSIPSLHRIAWLRRRIGADPQPFTALPAKPLQNRRHRRLAREIRALEARLVEHGEAIASVLEKRHDRS